MSNMSKFLSFALLSLTFFYSNGAISADVSENLERKVGNILNKRLECLKQYDKKAKKVSKGLTMFGILVNRTDESLRDIKNQTEQYIGD